MGQENLHDKIQQILGGLQGNFNILEEQIDIDVQMEYFESSKEIKNTLDREETLRNMEELFSDSFSIDQKKALMVRLASIDKVEAFRVLERYRLNPDPLLKDWALLAMQESKMLLESTFLEESKVFISTGLGGKGQKLRYFIVLLAKEGIVIDDIKKKIIHSETGYNFKKYDAEIEELKFSGTFSTLKVIIPISAQIQDMLEVTIENCNQFGDFMQMNFIVTNVKELSDEEIAEVLKTIQSPGQQELN
jgi:hypothetical protein